MVARWQKYSKAAAWVRLALGLSVLALGGAGCEATRHVPAGQYLLRGKPRFAGTRELGSEVAATAVRTAPNRRVILPKFYLHAWSLGRSLASDSLWVPRTLRRVKVLRKPLNSFASNLEHNIGDPPALADPDQLDRDAQNLQSTYFANGFFNTRVRWVVRPLRNSPRKARVVFYVEEGDRFYIRELNYGIPNDTLRNLLELNRRTSLLQPGEHYNEANLTNERGRISDLLRDNGYYTFTPSEVYYTVDTTVGRTGSGATQNLQELVQMLGQTVANLFTGETELKPRVRQLDITVTLRSAYVPYYIDSVTVQIAHSLSDTSLYAFRQPATLPDEDARDSLLHPKTRFSVGQPFQFLVTQRVYKSLNLAAVSQVISVRPGSPYNQAEVRRTQRRLQELGMFRTSALRFEVLDSSNSLHSRVLLTPLNRFNFRVGAEAFQSEDVRLNFNMPGLGLNTEFGKRNAFRRAEQLNLRLNGTVSFYRETDTAGNSNWREFFQGGSSLGITIPRLLFVYPLVKNWVKLYAPSTSLSGNFQFERPIDFQRTTISFDYTYQWLHTDKQPQVESRLTVLSLSVVNSLRTEAFTQRILAESADDPNLQAFIDRDFQPRFNSRSAYFLTFSDNYGLLRNRMTTFLRGGAELGGNIPYLLDVLGNAANTGDRDTRDGRFNRDMLYGQFYKLVGEAKAFLPLSERAELVGRVFVGYAHGWNYTNVIPLENRFFSGGTNSVRGWQANALGPGIFPPSPSALIAFGGEYKFEANLEFRRDLFSPVEFALFADAGNVWFTRDGGFDDPRGKLSAETLRLGLAAGLGIRLDFQFVVIRMDLGQQLHAPDVGVVVRSLRNIGSNRLQYNLAIGYPF